MHENLGRMYENHGLPLPIPTISVKNYAKYNKSFSFSHIFHNIKMKLFIN